MTTISLTVGDGTFPFECRELHGEERLDEPSRFDVVAFSAQAIAIDDVLGQPCSMRQVSRLARRSSSTGVPSICRSRTQT